VLPSTGAVSEFLVVPYGGASIHPPPPPLNQIVRVTMARGFESKGLFVPVWVTGTMSAGPGTRDLSLVDGAAPVIASKRAVSRR
jgi:hypothetical protein